ncbi:MAG: choice-of-anchor tandem repeat GloVer-containing protein, partial [Opitutaceae bacterium]
MLVPTVNVYINSTLVEQLTGTENSTVYDKAGAYAASSGFGPCMSTWQNILFWTGGSANGNTPVAVDTPNFYPAGGTYGPAQTVTLRSTTSGATFFYTTDNSTPAESGGMPIGTSMLYTGPITVSTTTTLNAIAFASGQTDSPVSSAVYTILPPVAMPAFSLASGTYTSAQTVTINTTTMGASVAYTTDGTTPTESGGTVIHGIPLSNGGSFSLGGNVTVNAIAFKIGLADSTVATATYTLQASMPFFSPTVGTYSSAQSVAIITTTSGALIAYTTDGSTPIESGDTITNGFPYTGSVNISSTTLLKAIAFKTGFTDSPVASGLYTIGSPAAVLNVIYNFTTANNGGTYPTSGLVQGSDGSFYGTANDGGIEDGAIFKITPAGVLAASASFYHTNGAHPFGASLVQGTDGNFYGTTEIGGSTYTGLLGNEGYGTVFQMTPTGALTTLYSFDAMGDPAAGYHPEADLAQGSDGNFYGTTPDGGDFGRGTVFQMTPGGVLTTLVSFNGTNGAYPFAGLVQGGDGNFYGTTTDGGDFGRGTVFQMT